MSEFEQENLQIGAAAEKFELNVPTLRDWCNEGLIKSYRGSRNARVIPTSEFKKIIRIKEILSVAGKTFEDVKQELYKDQLMKKDNQEKEKNEVIQVFTDAIDQSENMKMIIKVMEAMGEELKSVKMEIRELKEKQQLLPESASTEEKIKQLESDLEQERKEKEKSQENEKLEIEKLLQKEKELQDLKETIHEQEKSKQEEKKSFFKRLFGV